MEVNTFINLKCGENSRKKKRAELSDSRSLKPGVAAVCRGVCVGCCAGLVSLWLCIFAYFMCELKCVKYRVRQLNIKGSLRRWCDRFLVSTVSR